MKKILLVIFFLIVSMTTFAQIPSIGIKGGLNFATVSSSYNSSGSTSGSVTTFNAGVFVDFKFGKLSLQPALNYIGKGGTYQESLAFPGPNNLPGGIFIETVKENLYYLQLPVNLVYHFHFIVGEIYLGAGPYIAQGITGTTKYGENSQKQDFGSSSDDVKPQQFGADAIAGFKFKNGLLINANYDLGLTNDLPSSANNGNSKSRVFGVSLGYEFL